MRKDKAFAISLEVDGQKQINITPRKADSGFLLHVRMRNVDGVLEHSHVLKIYGEVRANGIVHIGVVTPLEGFERDKIGNLVKDGYRAEVQP